MTYRNPKYLAFVRTLPCSMCGSTHGIRAHHLRGVGHMSGVGMKAPDWATCPLDDDCHEKMQTTPELWPDQWEFISRTLGKAVEQGFFNKKK